MSANYGRLAFTPAVQAEQERHDSRRFYSRRQARTDTAADPHDPITEDVRAYLTERDSFYLATTSSTGWPYVQYRGGPPGFLTVLNEHTLGWADFRGNLQYISTGNLTTDDRVALIVMDYPHRERLKVFGRATYHDADSRPELAERLIDSTYSGKVERLVVVAVAALDWNCQQHITPRYTLEELQPQLDAARHRSPPARRR